MRYAIYARLSKRDDEPAIGLEPEAEG